jgi:hypothetical protein
MGPVRIFLFEPIRTHGCFAQARPAIPIQCVTVVSLANLVRGGRSG